MQKIGDFIKHHWHLLLLLFISIGSHWYVFFDRNILSGGDWVWVPQKLLERLISYGQWGSHSNFGSIISFSTNMVFYWTASILANISSFFSWDIFTRLFFLVPMVVLTPLFSFLLFKKIFKNDLVAFFCSFVYIFNTFFLKLQLDWITYAFIWWVLPALFLSVLNYLESKKNKYLIYNALFVFLGIVYEIRIMILVLLFFALFQVVYLIANNGKIKDKIRDNFYIFVSYGIGIVIHLFWLIPMMTSGIYSDVMSSASPSPFASFYDIFDAITLHMYTWSNNLVLEPFIKQPIEPRHFLIPLLVVVGIISFKKLFKSKDNKGVYFIFFIIALVVSVFLGKQGFSPLPNAYNWLFYNIPLFNLYRESGKFFILIALTTSFFFGLGLFYVYETFKKFNKPIAIFIAVVIIFLSSVFNLQHFVDQKIGGMTKGTMIDANYANLEKKLSSDNEFYRVLWIPVKPRFGFYSDRHPAVEISSFLEIFQNQAGFNSSLVEMPAYLKLLYLFQQNYSNSLFDDAGIKYVVVPIAETRTKSISATQKETIVAVYSDYGDRQSYINGLDEISWLKKTDLGTESLTVYENENYKESIFAIPELFNFGSLQQFNGNYDFTRKLSEFFYFTSGVDGKSVKPLVKIKNIFENTVLKNDAIVDSTGQVGSKTELHINSDANTSEEYLFLNSSNALLNIPIESKDKNIFEYKNPKEKFTNVITNPSFENGLWQDTVGDCNKYDEGPILAMSLNKEFKTDRGQSLQLEAMRHVACTSTGANINTTASASTSRSYLLSFDYQSPNANYARYYLAFNDKKNTVIKENLPIKDDNWNTFSRTFKIPEGATGVSLYVYADSIEDGKTNIINRYDNFKLIEIPDLSGIYYLVDKPDLVTREPSLVTFDSINPAKKLVHIKSVTAPFFLAMSEGYHSAWQLQFNNDKVRGLLNSWVPFVEPDKIPEENHYKLNDFLNVWYIDTGVYCVQNTTLCTVNADGSYDMEMVIEFFPQRWFYLGILISGIALFGCFGYMIYTSLK